jgi:hypothetical protein
MYVHFVVRWSDVPVEKPMSALNFAHGFIETANPDQEDPDAVWES